jgi:hypothetical protein
MLFHPLQLVAIAAMFIPDFWARPPQPSDPPPRPLLTDVSYKVVGGLALSQIIWFLPVPDRCGTQTLCGMIREHDEFLARTALSRHIPSRVSLAPSSRPYTSSLLKTTCSVVVIPSRPAPKCQNPDVHPTFEWAPQSPVPSFVMVHRSCSALSIPVFHGNETTYDHVFISPYPLPRPTDVAPVSRVLLIAARVPWRKFIGHILAMVWAALVIPAKSPVCAAGPCHSWRWMDVLAVLSRVQRSLVVAFKIPTWFIASCIFLGFYLIGDVNVNAILVSTLLVDRTVVDAVVSFISSMGGLDVFEVCISYIHL